jgi:hypothetical protein
LKSELGLALGVLKASLLSYYTTFDILLHSLN